MLKNVGSVDKIIRLVIAFALIAYGVYFKSLIGFVAVIPLATALMNFCPLYTVCGLKTCSKSA